MDDKKDDRTVFELIDGFKPVDPKSLAEFQRVMMEEVIPETVKIVEERRLRAAESRRWQLKC